MRPLRSGGQSWSFGVDDLLAVAIDKCLNNLPAEHFDIGGGYNAVAGEEIDDHDVLFGNLYGLLGCGCCGYEE